MHRVFVYGSLKKGFGNHDLISNQNLEGADSVKGAFKMISLGGFPGVLGGERFDKSRISVESYLVDDNSLQDLDRLESEGDFYHRRVFVSEGFMYILDDRYDDDYDLAPFYKDEKGDLVYEW